MYDDTDGPMPGEGEAVDNGSVATAAPVADDDAANEPLSKQSSYVAKIVEVLDEWIMLFSPAMVIVVVSSFGDDPALANLPVTRRVSRAELAGDHLHLYNEDGDPLCLGPMGGQVFMQDLSRLISCPALDADTAAWLSQHVMSYVTDAETQANPEWQAARDRTVQAIRDMKAADSLGDLVRAFKQAIAESGGDENDAAAAATPIVIPRTPLPVS